MSHVKTFFIICVAAVVSFFVAQAVIPEKEDAVRRAAQRELSQVLEEMVEQPQAPLAGSGEDIPVVTVAPLAEAVTVSEIKTITADTMKTAAPAAEAPKPKPAAAQKRDPAVPYKIESAALCGAIVNKGPHNITDKYSKDAPHVYYFTHLVGARDSTAIIHRWYHQGKLIQTSVLPVRSPNWRTHSKRKLSRSEDPTGQWKVEAVEPKSGRILESAAFKVE